MYRAVLLGLVALSSLIGAAAEERLVHESSSSDSSPSVPAAVEIERGTVGQVGGSRVAVVSLAATAPPVQGAMPGATATVVAVNESGSVRSETTQIVGEHMLVPLADGLHRVERVSPPTGANGRGYVAIASTASRPQQAGSAFLAEAGRLRLGGPQVDAATDIRIVAVEPDTRAPQTVTLEWLPAAFAREDTPAIQIRRQAVKLGDRVQVGKASLTVKAIEGAGTEHPCWVEFGIAAAR